MATILKRKVVGIMGSGTEAHERLARQAGNVVAECGFDLLTGAGGGVMTAAACAYVHNPARRGLSIGIVRAQMWPDLIGGRREWKGAHKNPWIDIWIRTHLPDSSIEYSSRNHINVLSSDAVVVLPGEDGTLSELQLAVEYGLAPVALFLGGQRLAGHFAEHWIQRYPSVVAAGDQSALVLFLKRKLLGFGRR